MQHGRAGFRRRGLFDFFQRDEIEHPRVGPRAAG
jgi:hypothetical protein